MVPWHNPTVQRSGVLKLDTEAVRCILGHNRTQCYFGQDAQNHRIGM